MHVSTLRRSLPALLGGTLLGLILTASSLVHEADMVRAFIGGDTSAASSVTTGPSAADLIAANDCWTGEAPADVEVPGHVVVSAEGEARYAGERMVGKALEQLFDGADHGLQVHGFCR